MADLPRPTARALASRRNGARSQGPRTTAGKARSARNALTHGLRSRRQVLLHDEDAAELRAFAAALQAGVRHRRTNPGKRGRAMA